MSRLVLLGLVLVGMPARAEDSPALYQATAIVTGTDMRQRPLGFARCLAEVLAKVSGRPSLGDDPAVAALAGRAGELVRSYEYLDPRAGRVPHDDQGRYDRSYELTVVFDPGKVDAALAGLGAAPWRGVRPLLEPVILVRPTNEVPFYLSAETPRGTDMRATIVGSASRLGLGVHFPTQSELDAWGLVPFGFPAPVTPLDPSQLDVLGSMEWDIHVGGWVGVWRVRQDGVSREWRVAGVGFDQALADMVRGAVTVAHTPARPLATASHLVTH